MKGGAMTADSPNHRTLEPFEDFAHALELRPILEDGPPQRTLVGPLLIAGQDAEYLRGALRVAELLARRDRVNAHVLGAVPPLGIPQLLLLNVDHEALEDGRQRQFADRLRQRLHRTAGRAAQFSVEAVAGSAAIALARAAQERRSQFIVVGLEEHGVRGRAATEDAALQVRGAAGIPVLAVPAGQTQLPRRALVAMDFSAASLRAARSTIPLLAKGATLTLAHVEPRVDFRTLGMHGWAEIYERGVAAMLAPLATALSVPDDITVDIAMLRTDDADPAVALLERAQRDSSDLIATGTQGHTALDRHLTGSVSTALLRGARCVVLIAPPE
jgi:nucleotide-binding universal stress UspA family protein